MSQSFRLIAHRGASAHAPENTLVAFRHALELGAQEVELDVRLSSDGEIVVFHDDRLDEKKTCLAAFDITTRPGWNGPACFLSLIHI